MSTSRIIDQYENDALKRSLLGQEDSAELKLQTQHVVRYMEELTSKAKFGVGLAALVQKAFTARSVFEKGAFMEPDGEIMAIIRQDIEECIDKGYIQSREEGTKHIKQYLDIVKNILHGPQFNTIDTSLITQLQEEVRAKRDAMQKDFLAAPPRKRATPQPVTVGQKEQAFDRNNLDENALAEKMISAVNSSASFKAYGVPLRTEINKAFLTINDQGQTQYGPLLAIISADIKEAIEKGNIKSNAELTKRTEQYRAAIIGALVELNPKRDQLDINAITDKLKEAIYSKRDAMRAPDFKLQEEKKMAAHIERGKEYTQTNLNKAKETYKDIYKGISKANKNFIATRRFFNSSLKQQEQLMIQLGATKKDIQEFKKGLQSEELSARTSVSKPAASGQSVNTAETSQKSRMSKSG